MFEAELAHATELARQAGQTALALRGPDLAVEQKGENDPVTEADRAAEAVILAGLAERFPNDGVLSEEQPDVSSWAAADRAWLVDPIDGTKDFIAGRDGFAVMIGLLVNGTPKLGVVHQPRLNLTYRGVVGGRAELVDGNETQSLCPSEVDRIEQMRLVASFSNRSKIIDETKAALSIDDELNIGSVGIKIGLIARGHRDLYVNPTGHCKLWDVCAPQAILEAAGGTLTDLHGDPVSYDPQYIRLQHGLLASNGRRHGEVVSKLARLFPRR